MLTKVPVSKLVKLALEQKGKPYRFGVEVDGLEVPSAFDCSELVEWVCDRCGVVPKMPDGAYWQWRHCVNHGSIISVESAVRTKGALLFRIKGKNLQNHVAFSLGNGTTMEARGARYGCGVFSTSGRTWTHGALIPGVDYGKTET